MGYDNDNVQMGTLNEDGTLTNVRVIKSSDIIECVVRG